MNYADAREFWNNILNMASFPINEDILNKVIENFVRFCGWRPSCDRYAHSIHINDWTFTRIHKAKEPTPYSYSLRE